MIKQLLPLALRRLRKNRSSSDDTYSVSVYLVFDVTHDPAKAEAVAKSASEKIANLFKQSYLVNGNWKDIELVECMSVSEATMTIHQARLLKAWNFDYLSLREAESDAV